jgi:hypothetical protein
MMFSNTDGFRGRTAYNTWKSLKDKPSVAAFVRLNDFLGGIYHVTFFPNTNTIYIRIDFTHWTMEGIARVVVDECSNTLYIVDAICDAQNHQEGVAWFPSGIGGFDFFKSCIDQVFRKQADVFVNPFFGPNWNVCFKRDIEKMHELTEEMYGVMQDWHHYLPRDKMWKTIAHFDYTRNEAACTRITAAFRGWCVRRKYRFNPHNSFGRFLINRMFEEALMP